MPLTTFDEATASMPTGTTIITPTPPWMEPAFVARCAAAGVPPTRRQLSKVRNGYGAVVAHERRQRSPA